MSESIDEDTTRPTAPQTSPGFRLHALESLEEGFDGKLDILCFSHLRWDFVWQRPQHLMTRFARQQRVYYLEEPVPCEEGSTRLELQWREPGITVVTPHLPASADEARRNRLLKSLVDDLLAACVLRDFVLWYYTPMALPFTKHLRPAAAVYDCMDELSAFRGAPGRLKTLEVELLARTDVVFTGGHALYEAKKSRHPNVHPFPSSIDAAHFRKARLAQDCPEEQDGIPRPRLGFFGVIDERMDLALLDAVAAYRPDWSIVMIGPVVKIDASDLPRRPNIHYLGRKSYEMLPFYLSGWDVALLPFAINESTRYISPTKTPEYLAAGIPVVSTPIEDVVNPYGVSGLVRIAHGISDYVRTIEETVDDTSAREDWLRRVDEALSFTSWDRTWAGMSRLVDEAAEKRRKARAATNLHALLPTGR